MLNGNWQTSRVSLLDSHGHGFSISLQKVLGPVSISEKTSFRKILSSLEAARFVFRIIRSLCNLTGTSAAVLPMCLSNFKAIRQFKVPISWLRDFTRSYEKTSFRILRRGPGALINYLPEVMVYTCHGRWKWSISSTTTFSVRLTAPVCLPQ